MLQSHNDYRVMVIDFHKVKDFFNKCSYFDTKGALLNKSDLGQASS